MTNRALYPFAWASSGVVKDPDTDTTAPSYKPDRYKSIGWLAEKPPEDWQNFLQNISDDKLIAVMTTGLPYLDSEVTYQDGSLYQDSGKAYLVVGGVGVECLSLDGLEYSNLVVALRTLLTGHLTTTNPHNDSVDTLLDKSYLKGFVDSTFGSPTDPTTITYHKSRTGVVHAETAAQLGTLHKSGGKFTGPVSFLESMLVVSSPAKIVHLNKATALVEVALATAGLGVDSAGSAFVSNSSGMFKVATEENFTTLETTVNPQFALPCPLLAMNLESSLCDASSVGAWMVETSLTPDYSESKGLKVEGSVTISGMDIGSAHRLFVRGVVAGSPTTATSLRPAHNYETLADVIDKSGKDFTHIKQVVIYPILSAQQLSTLVTS